MEYSSLTGWLDGDTKPSTPVWYESRLLRIARRLRLTTADRAKSDELDRGRARVGQLAPGPKGRDQAHAGPLRRIDLQFPVAGSLGSFAAQERRIPRVPLHHRSVFATSVAAECAPPTGPVDSQPRSRSPANQESQTEQLRCPAPPALHSEEASSAHLLQIPGTVGGSSTSDCVANREVRRRGSQPLQSWRFRTDELLLSPSARML